MTLRERTAGRSEGHDLRRRAAGRPPERAEDPRARRCAPSSSTGWPTPGMPRIEAVSFVSPAHVPQMAGAEEVVAAIERRRRRRLRRARPERARATTGSRETGLDEVHFAFAATETFNRRNQNASVEESLETAERIVARAHEDGHPRDGDDRRRVRLPFEGAVDPGRVARPRRAAGRRREPTRSSSPTRSASASRARCASSSARR